MSTDNTSALPAVDAGPPPYEELLESIRRAVATLLQIDIAAVQPESVLLDLGAQSCHFVELAMWIERTHRVTLPPDYAVPDVHTVEAFAAAVVEQLAIVGDGA
jgi:acyl carrier protein